MEGNLLGHFAVGENSAALTGLGTFVGRLPRALPWAIIFRAFSPLCLSHVALAAEDQNELRLVSSQALASGQA